jgi:hypothetical protein
MGKKPVFATEISDVVLYLGDDGSLYKKREKGNVKEKLNQRIYRLQDRDELRLLVVEEPGKIFDTIVISLIWPKNFPQPKLNMIAVHGVGGKEIYVSENQANYVAYYVGEKALITIIASWPKGTFDLPWYYRLKDWLATRPGYLWLATSSIVALIGLLTVGILAFRRFQERVMLKPSIRTTPPGTLPPAIIGVLLRQKIGPKEILATLLDLANRGYLYMLDKENQLIFTIRKNDSVGLYGFEKALLEEIFKEKDFALRHDFSKSKINDLFLSIYDLVFRLGLFVKNPRDIHLRWRLWGVLIAIFGILGFLVSMRFFPDPPYVVLFWIGLIICGVIIFDLGHGFTAYTKEGLTALQEWLSFANFLGQADSTVINSLRPEIYIRFLPYAIVFNKGAVWSKKFSHLPFTLPNWFISDRPIHSTIDFYQSLIPLRIHVAESLIREVRPEID